MRIFNLLVSLNFIIIIISSITYCGPQQVKKFHNSPESKSGLIRHITVCPGSQTDPEAFELDETIMSCGSDIYIVKAWGKVPEKYKNSNRKTRRKQSKQRAVINAQYSFFTEMEKIRTKFVKPLNTDTVYYDFSGIDPWYLELKAIIKSGKVLCESYDSGGDCVLIYGFYIKDFNNWIKADNN